MNEIFAKKVLKSCLLRSMFPFFHPDKETHSLIIRIMYPLPLNEVEVMFLGTLISNMSTPRSGGF